MKGIWMKVRVRMIHKNVYINQLYFLYNSYRLKILVHPPHSNTLYKMLVTQDANFEIFKPSGGCCFSFSFFWSKSNQSLVACIFMVWYPRLLVRLVIVISSYPKILKEISLCAMPK